MGVLILYELLVVMFLLLFLVVMATMMLMREARGRHAADDLTAVRLPRRRQSGVGWS